MSTFDTWNSLNQFSLGRKRFDPSSKLDLEEFAFFRRYSKWRNGCPFYLEWPYQDIVTMCQTRLSDYTLRKILKQE